MPLFKKNKMPDIDYKALVEASGLKHIAFIMDGNGRWATNKGMPREMGHKAGAETFEKVARYCNSVGIKTVTVYAFSTENWKRPKGEVDALMRLLDSYIERAERDNEENKIRYIFIGDKNGLPEALKEKCLILEALTENNENTINLAINYGGRAEIVHAVNSLIADGKTEVSADDISNALYTNKSPEPDLIVRTGNEMRLSNFLMWQSAYSELYFTDRLWPDFGNDDVNKAIVEFSKRKRRFGGIYVTC